MKTQNISLYLSLFVLLVAAFITLNFPFQVNGEGWTPVHIQTATTTTVGPDTVVTLFADQTSPTCHARVITTNEDPILISFDDVVGFGSTTLTTNAGHFQAASTTVVYDSALYGCGLMTALGVTASGTVTISSF